MDLVILSEVFLPVGATKDIFKLGFSLRRLTKMATSKYVFPVPGPPVITAKLFWTASFSGF